MNLHSDILKLIVSKLDNNSIKNLSLVPGIWNEISLFARDEYFWFLRTEELLSRDLKWQEDNWKEAYYILSSSRDIDNSSDNVLAASILLSLKVDPSKNNNLLIRLICARDHPRILRLLLEDGRVDPSIDQNHLLLLASSNEHLEIIKLLLQDKRVINSKHIRDSIDQSLEYAYMNKDREVFDFLMEWKMDNSSLFS